MAEKITFDTDLGVLLHEVTTVQKNQEGQDVTNATRWEYSGAGLIAARRDPALEAKLSEAIKKQIADREEAINAQAQAEAAQ